VSSATSAAPRPEALPASDAVPASPTALSSFLGSGSARARIARWAMTVGLVVAVTVSVWSMHRVPHASWQPALLGLLPWVLGKYVLCPLRWHALSCSRQNRRWHLRVYAESELIGLASPAHIGADLWRMHKLQHTGLNRPSAIAEVGLDRLVGAIGLSIFVVLSGVALPPQLLLAAVGIAAVVVLAVLVLHRLRPGALAARPLPRPRVLVTGVLYSMGYQLSIIGLLLGNVAAMGAHVQPLALLGVFGASQVAGIIPGVGGASPRNGALVIGLASLGLTWTAALGAVALTAVIAWLPALLLGGSSLGVRRVRAATT
jgi:glycosyltransferase 2 family protein